MCVYWLATRERLLGYKKRVSVCYSRNCCSSQASRLRMLSFWRRATHPRILVIPAFVHLAVCQSSVTWQGTLTMPTTLSMNQTSSARFFCYLLLVHSFGFHHLWIHHVILYSTIGTASFSIAQCSFSLPCKVREKKTLTQDVAAVDTCFSLWSWETVISIDLKISSYRFVKTFCKKREFWIISKHPDHAFQGFWIFSHWGLCSSGSNLILLFSIRQSNYYIGIIFAYYVAFACTERLKIVCPSYNAA